MKRNETFRWRVYTSEMRRFAGCSLLFACLAFGRQPAGRCIVEGQVLNALTREALVKAAVHLFPESGPNPGYATATDNLGNFHFENIDPGDYSLEAERSGYLTGSLGAQTPSARGVRIHLAAGSGLDGLQIQLLPRSIASGKVRDDTGEPVAHASITAYSSFWSHGHRRSGFRSQTQTNDAGEYEIADLDPGKYYFYVDPGQAPYVDQQGGPAKRLLPALYPGGRSLADALPLEIRAGENLTGIDFRLRSGRVFRVKGTLSGGLAASQLSDVEASLIGPDYEIPVSDDQSGKGGAFELTDLPAGDFRIAVTDQQHNVIAAVPLALRTRDASIVIALPEPLQVGGVVRRAGIDANSPPSSSEPSSDDFSGISVDFIPEGKGPSESYSADVHENGTFTLRSLPSGKYSVSVFSSDPAEYVKSVRVAAREILGQVIDFSSAAGPIEIVVSKGAGSMRGTLRQTRPEEEDSRAAALESLMVILVSDPARYDNAGFYFGRADQNGDFHIQPVAPGNYIAFAGPELDFAWFERPDFLEQIRDTGQRVEIPENGNVEVHLSPLDAKAIERAASAITQ